MVLLSPACASFDQFRSFEVRGNVFRQLVEELDAEDLRLAVDARDLPTGTYTVGASVELRRSLASGSVTVEPVQPERFELVLE